MNHVDLTNANIEELITHYVGNKQRDEGIIISQESSLIKAETSEYLIKYFLSQIKPIHFYNFGHAVSLDLNEVYVSIRNMFHHTSDFKSNSQNLAKLLYEYSSHPKIKSGEFNVVLFDNLIIGDEMVQGIGLFKSETNVPFIQMKKDQSNYRIDHEFGFELNAIDKGCLVLNSNEEDGYLVLIVENISGDAQYWLEEFLKLKSANDDYNNTRQFMNIAKNFLTKELPKDSDVSKTEKIDLLNKTVDYFKNNESFEKSEFENDVLKDDKVIHSFREFDKTYRSDHQIELKDSFEISGQAVKKQTRYFKSILKLDKNFHVYIHGGKDLIHRGVETDGRKFYKIYYEHEG